MFLLLKEKLAKAVSEAAKVPLDEADASIELPRGQFGDVASSIAFRLAKGERKSPAENALTVAGKLMLPNWVEHAKAEGPYVNFLLSDAFYSELLAKVGEEKSGFGRGKKRKPKPVVKSPSVTPNKPGHIGHGLFGF